MNDGQNTTSMSAAGEAAGASNVANEAGGSPTPGLAQTPEVHPGDDAPAGTVGTGEDICPRCSGSGKLEGDRACPDCDGTGIIVQGIGGG